MQGKDWAWAPGPSPPTQPPPPTHTHTSHPLSPLPSPAPLAPAACAAGRPPSGCAPSRGAASRPATRQGQRQGCGGALPSGSGSARSTPPGAACLPSAAQGKLSRHCTAIPPGITRAQPGTPVSTALPCPRAHAHLLLLAPLDKRFFVAWWPSVLPQSLGQLKRGLFLQGPSGTASGLSADQKTWLSDMPAVAVEPLQEAWPAWKGRRAGKGRSTRSETCLAGGRLAPMIR